MLTLIQGARVGLRLSDGASLGAGDRPTNREGDGAELGVIVGSEVDGASLGLGDGAVDGEAGGAGLGAKFGAIVVGV